MIKIVNPGVITPKLVMFKDIIYSKPYAPLIDKTVNLEMIIMTDEKLAVWKESNPPEKRPAILWLMGGAWVGCPPEKALPEMEYYARRGYVVAAARYRVSSEAIFPAQLIDALTAVKFLKVNSDEFRIDPDRIAVMGLSAGGHLAAFVAMNPEGFEGGEWNSVTSTVKAGVDMFGPTDIVALNEANAKKPPMQISVDKMHMMGAKPPSPLSMLLPSLSAEEKLIGGKMAEKIELAKEASPIHYISDATSPILILHGSDDKSVVPEQSIALHDALNAAGHSTDLYIIKGAGHNTAEFYQESVKEIILDFLDEHV